jgi:hypothetical protein
MNNILLGKLIIRTSIGFFILMIILNIMVLQMKVFPYFNSLPDGYPVDQQDYWMRVLLKYLRFHVLNSLLSLLIIHVAKLLDVYQSRDNAKIATMYHLPVRETSLEVFTAITIVLVNGTMNIWMLADTRTLNLF